MHGGPHGHGWVNLDTETCPTKEQRLGSVNAYRGKLSQLFVDAEKGALPVLHRRFQQTEVCLVIQAGMRMMSIRDAAIIVHGPVGCSSPLNTYREIFKNIPEELGRPPFDLSWLSTNLGEADVVFGGADKLKETILEAQRRYEPKAIFVITTCATGIIGDDVEGAIESLAPDVAIPVVPVHCEAFRTAISQTAFDAFAHAAVKYLVKPPRRKQDDLVVIPAPFSITWSDRLEINRLLQKLDLRVLYIPDFATVEELQYVSEGAVIAPTCQSYGDYWQMALHEKFDIPFFRHPAPLGMKNTAVWLREIARYTGREQEAEELIEEELAFLEPKIEALKREFAGTDASILVAAGQPRCVSTPLLAHELGIGVKAVQTLELDSVMVDQLREVYEEVGDFELHASNWQPFELVHHDNRLKPDLHTACPMMGLFRRSGGMARNHSYRSDFSTPANQLGFRGVLHYGYLMLRALHNPAFSRKLNRRIRKPYRDWWLKQDDMFHYTVPEGFAATAHRDPELQGARV